MSEPNPYVPPGSRLERPLPKGPLGAPALIVVVLAAAQILNALVTAPAALDRIRTGEVSPLIALIYIWSLAFLALGGFRIFRRHSVPHVAASIALITSLIALWKWRETWCIGQFFVSACMVVYAFGFSRAKKDA